MTRYTLNIIKILLVSAVIALAACDADDKQIIKLVSKDESGIPVYEVDQTYANEDLTDPEFYKYPRLQFVWSKRNGELPVLMSIRTDGTDLRQVINPETVFYGGAKHFTHKPVRSPNRRYLAYSNTATGISLPDRVIYDLKSSERITIIKSQTGKAQYFWSPDSENLFFHGDEMYRYHVPSKTLHQLPEFIYGAGFYALPDNKTILAITLNGIAYHDYEGKLLKEIDLGFKDRSISFNSVTPDGKELFIFGVNPASIWVQLEPQITIRKSLVLPEGLSFSSILKPDTGALYLRDNKHHMVLFNLSTETLKVIFKINAGISNYSLMY